MPPRKKSSAKAQGIFHGLSEVLQEAIVRVAMKDTPSTRKKTMMQSSYRPLHKE
jgi:hypothetical protein